MSVKIIDILGGRKILSKEPYHQLDFIKISQGGIPKLTVENLANYLQISIQQLMQLLPISLRTLQRKGNKDRLDKMVSEKILHIAEVAAKGTEVFEDREKFIAWLHRPNVALGDQSPMSLLDSNYGVNMVLEEMGRLEYGVFA